MKPLEVPAQLRRSIADYLWRYVQRRRRVELVRAACLAMLVVMLWLLAWGTADRFLGLSTSVRLVGLVALLLIIAAILRRSVVAMLRNQLDWLEAAEQLERRDPSLNQVLATVVSQALGDPARRGSPRMIQLLQEQTESAIGRAEVPNLVPLKPAIRAVVAVSIGLAVMLALCMWSWMGLPRLLLRQVAPLAKVAPVTTTHLSVTPGNLEIAQGQQVVITAKAEPANPTMLIRTSTDGENWNSVGMTPDSTGAFTYTISALLRDLKYEVSAGDASAGPFDVHVRRRPLVREFRFRLEYPPYVGREPLSFSNTDGAVEAPVGSNLEITVVASEPLVGAWIAIGPQRMELHQTADPRARRLTTTIDADARWSVEMLSDRQVLGSGPGDMSIRAIPDRPPLARLVFPSGSSLLRPRDIVRIPFQAGDDYALASLEALVDVDRAALSHVTIKNGAGLRHIEDFLPLDLAQFNVVIGQMLTVTLAATDRAGQTTLSVPCQILITAQAIEPDQRRRAAELKAASKIASQISTDLASAMQPDTTPKSRLSARIASMTESASILVSTILRAGVGAVDPSAGLIEALTDDAQVLASRMETINTQVSVESPESLRTRLAIARDAAVKLDALLEPVWRGMNGSILQAQRQSLLALPDPKQPIAVQLRDEIAAGISELGLQVTDADLDSALGRMVQAADGIVRTATKTNYAEAVSVWAGAAQPQNEFLAERLLTAAQAQAIRADGDLVWARDLQLASRAARTIDALVAPAGQPSPAQEVRQAYVDAFRALDAEHRLALRAREVNIASTTSPQSLGQASMTDATVHAQAIAARRRMFGWAGEAELSVDPDAAVTDEQVGAMQANALVAQKQYDQAQALDARIYPTSSPAAQRIAAEMSRVRRITELDEKQQAVTTRASQQRELGAEIGQMHSADQIPELSVDSRQQGLLAVRQMQEDLADLPQRLGRVEQALERARQAQELAKQSAREAETAPTDLRTASEHAARIAGTSADEAFESLQQLQRSSDVEAESIVVDELKGYAPETSSAVSAISRQLTPALVRLSDRIAARDVEGASHAIADARKATADVQDDLREARQALLDRNPLVAARWFAEQAAAELQRPSAGASTRPTTAETQQARTLAELRRAWDDSVHRAAEARLSGIASMSSIMRFYGIDPDGSGGAAPEWGRQRSWQTDAVKSAARAADPVGYQEALRIYFKVLNETESKERSQ